MKKTKMEAECLAQQQIAAESKEQVSALLVEKGEMETQLNAVINERKEEIQVYDS